MGKLKICKKCGESKPLTEYYNHATNKDGKGGSCKDCYNKGRYTYAKNNIDMSRAWQRKYADSKKGTRVRGTYYKNNKSRLFEAFYKRAKKLPKEVIKAYSIVVKAKRNGKLIQQYCIECGNEKSQAHHEDYSKPLEVIWLCRKHHAELHRKENKC